MTAKHGRNSLSLSTLSLFLFLSLSFSLSLSLALSLFFSVSIEGSVIIYEYENKLSYGGNGEKSVGEKVRDGGSEWMGASEKKWIYVKR
jgi:hypothetical protein